MNNQNWVPFFEEFANKVLEYKDNREELIDIINIVFKNAIAEEKDIKFPYCEHTNTGKERKLTDIDPFWIVSISNRYKFYSKYYAIFNQYKKLLKMKNEVPDEYYGIPIMEAHSLKFYKTVKEAPKGLIDELWEFYEVALNYADNPNKKLEEEFIDKYNKLHLVNNIKWNITVFLYDMRPNFYINLDSVNQGYCNVYFKDSENYNHILNNIKAGDIGREYLDFCSEVKKACASGEYEFDSLPDFSNKAYDYSQDGNQEDYDNDDDAEEYNEDEDYTQYWVYAPGKNAYAWEDFYEKGIMGLGWAELGDLSQYDSREEIKDKLSEIYGGSNNTNSSLANWEFCNSIQEGDIVYAKKGKNIIVGRGIVTSDYIYDENDSEFYSIRKVNWTNKGYWECSNLALKTLTEITYNTDLIDAIENAINPSGNNKVVNNMKNIEFKSENIIFYGVPGCGKSYYIKHDYIKDYKNKEEQVERVVFHPDYTYSDFIGQVLPKSENNDVKYKFEPGPFTKILKKAHNNPTVEYFLIIEEINRGNAPAIFGDIFQLLDRDDDGESEYSINNEDIADIVFEDKDKKIKIPKNLTLVATMNTSDQNVFTLDTAFQRRWDMELIENKFDKDKIKDMYIPGTDCKWSVFWEKINNKIESNSNTLSSEDKRLGTYFIRKSNLCDNPNDPSEENKIKIKIKKFAEKVFKYLWDDAFKMDKYICFNKDYKTLEAVIKEFNSSKDLSKIFNSNIDFKSVEDTKEE